MRTASLCDKAVILLAVLGCAGKTETGSSPAEDHASSSGSGGEAPRRTASDGAGGTGGTGGAGAAMDGAAGDGSGGTGGVGGATLAGGGGTGGVPSSAMECSSTFECAGANLYRCDQGSLVLLMTCASPSACDANLGICSEPVCDGLGCGSDTPPVPPDEPPDEPHEPSENPPEVGGLDGRLIQFPCADTTTTDDCRASLVSDSQVVACQDDYLEVDIDHPVYGEIGQEYWVTLHFYGILEPKNYGNGVTRDAVWGRPDLSGGTPTSWAESPANHQYPGSNYSTYELRIEDENQREIAVYYLNSDTQEGHYTMIVDYEKTIMIVGGGNVHFRSLNVNCQQIKNCGTAGGYPCAGKVRMVDVSLVDPPVVEGLPPEGFDQPSLGQDTDNAGQWLLIDMLQPNQ